MSHPVTLAALAGIGGLLGLAGPFGTDTLLPLLPRTGYWLFLACATYGAGLAVSLAPGPGLAKRSAALRIAVTGGATSVAVCAVVLGTNFAVFGWWPDRGDWPVFLPTLVAMTLIITALLDYVGTQRAQTAPPTDAPQPPAILDRLPLDKRGALVSLSVEDHYVRVRTVRGEEMLLMRLSDAIREVGDTPGAQVHRSHWVAFGQVRAARREGDRGILTLTTGPEIPVSRANMPRIREAGLLPR